MTGIVHSTVATLPDEAGAEVNKAEWNADHAITGDVNFGGFSILNAVIAGSLITGLGTMSTQNANAVAITGGSATGLTSLSVVAGTLTTDVKPFSQTLTWNNAAVTFTAWDMVITDTASAAGSWAARIRGGASGTTELLALSKTGNLLLGTITDSGYKLRVNGQGYFDSGFITGTGLTQTSSGLMTFGGNNARFVLDGVLNASSYARIEFQNQSATKFYVGIGSSTGPFSISNDGGTGGFNVSQGNLVGIGTGSPGATLDVVGVDTLRLSDVTTDATRKQPFIEARHYTNSEEPIAMMLADSQAASSDLYIGGGLSSSLNAVTSIRLFTAANNTTVTGTERVRIDSAGNVGIGTTAPTNKLVISNGGAGGLEINPVSGLNGGTTIFTYDRTTPGYKQMSFVASNFRFVTASTDPALDILANGNVGIGTTGPTAVLHLKAGTATANTAPLKLTSGALNTTAEAGAIEFLTDAYYATITTGAVRKTLAFLESPTFTGTVTIPTLVSTTKIRLKGYTVATLPTGTQGDTAFVTDAAAPAFLATIAGGGAVVTPVFYDGANWVGF